MTSYNTDFRSANNTFYVTYMIDVVQDQKTFKLPFPDMVQNIKANRALICIDSLELVSIDNANYFLQHEPGIYFDTNISSPTTFVQSTADGVPRSTTYMEFVEFSTKSSYESVFDPATNKTKQQILGLGYRRASGSSPHLVTNPMGQTFTCSFVDQTLAPYAHFDNHSCGSFVLTLKVQLLEEEIHR